MTENSPGSANSGSSWTSTRDDRLHYLRRSEPPRRGYWFRSHSRSDHGKQHFLNFLPLPQGHGSLRPTPLNGFWYGSPRGRGLSISTCCRYRSRSARYFSVKQYHPDSSSIVSPNSAYSLPPGRNGSPGRSMPCFKSSSKSPKPRRCSSMKPRSKALLTRTLNSPIPSMATALCQPYQT